MMSQYGLGIIESKEVYIPTDTEFSNCWYIQIRIKRLRILGALFVWCL